MSTCDSCGGVIGRDCFNPQECAEITYQQANDGEYYRHLLHETAAECDRLKAVNAELLEALQRVVSISDRKHDAWDAARAAIEKATGEKQPWK